MTDAAPFPTIDLNDAPRAASLSALVAGTEPGDRTFELFTSTVIPNDFPRFADLWHLPNEVAQKGAFTTGPLTSAPVFVRSVSSALVHPASGLAFDRHGNVFLQTLTAERFRDRILQRIAPCAEAGRRHALDLAASPPQGPAKSPLLYANHGGYTVFGHFMHETLPMALIFAPWLRSGQMRMLMPNARNADMCDNLLALIGLEPGVQLRAREDFVWRQRMIVSSTCSSRPTFAPGPMAHALGRTIKGTIRARQGPRRRIFLTRAGERTTQKRNLVNESELMAALAPMGFVAVNPGLLPGPQQVALFAQAECVVGLMGSVWANLIYAQPRTLVVDLLPMHKAMIPDTFGINAAKSMSLPYILIVTPSAGPSPARIEVTANVPLIADRIRRGLERLQEMG